VAVEAQIASALPLAADELASRAAVTDREDPGYLQEESLVALIRHFARWNDRGRINALAELLLKRCEQFTRQHLIGLGEDAFEEGHARIVAGLFRRILDLSSNRDDFLQCRFWVRLERLTVDEFRHQLRELRKRRREAQISVLPGSDPDRPEQQDRESLERQVKPVRGVSIATPSVEHDYLEEETELAQAAEMDRQRALLPDALSVLKGDLLAAFVLRHRDGMLIESKDPQVPTISRLLGKTPRTIRTWLKNADDAIAQWRGEKQ
jgi:hypothetical protein